MASGLMCKSLLQKAMNRYCFSKNLIFKKKVCGSLDKTQFIRRACTCREPSEHPLVYQQLTRRGLIQVSGLDAGTFLQGLMTNDITLLKNDVQAIYAMFLDARGRIQYDTIIYHQEKGSEKPTYLVECEKDGIANLIPMLKRYKIRKKVDVSDVSDTYKLWSVLPEQAEIPTSKLTVDMSNQDTVLYSVPDPRLPCFSNRLVLLDGVSVSSVVNGASESEDKQLYERRRMQLGIGEGSIDMPPGNSLPLECNAAFLNGVSFSKGCYIGQELTARTHHTGVIRKRLMPFKFNSEEHNGSPGDVVENDKAKNCGKIRSFVGADGLGLLRVADVVGKQSLRVRDESKTETATGDTHIPAWWPVESDEIIRRATGLK